MKRLGIYDMGKDIDRNITRQLWEKNVSTDNVPTDNVFTKNDIIPVENGGTGVNNLELFTQKLNVFTKNDIISVENGGTGVTNTNDIVSVITNGTKYIRRVNNTYKNEKIDKIISGYLVINSNSFFINLFGQYNLVNHTETETLVVAEFKNTGFLPQVTCDFVYAPNNTTINMKNGTIKITTDAKQSIQKIDASTFQQFITFPV